MGPAPTPPDRPSLKSALRRVWRDSATLQLGVDPHRAIVISGLDETSARLIERLDGTRDHDALRHAAAELGLAAARLTELVTLLDRAGALDDGPAERGVAGLTPRDRERLAPDLAAASLVRGGRDGGAGVLERRKDSAVAVHGAGRVGASVVSLLAAAGVGTVVIEDAALTRGCDTAPCGATATDVGARRHDTALRAARRVAPGVRARLAAGREQPDLVVLTPDERGLEDLPDRLLRRGVPHLFATVRDGTGVVGPLVLPGRSSCHRCHDLHRTDRDPAWPRVAAQLAGRTPQATTPCDVVLATAVAAQAAAQVLAHLDGDRPPPTVDGTIEISQADGRTRRRGWTVHPLCGCGWAQP
ncbi:MAG: hypothetical protein QOI54_960 [Actinomycetota bacterium]|jgi:hypothetical protein|nr:hypothetical protein [Actinomycetota bacterium]